MESLPEDNPSRTERSQPLDEEAAAAARAAARAAWPVRVSPLGEAPEAFAPASATAGERFAMVWRLTLDAWALAGLPIPTYARHEAPGGLRRLGDPPLEFPTPPR